MNIRQWCSQVFKYAIVNLKADSDPTAVLQGVVVRPKIKHNVPLTPDQITGLLKEMAKFGGYRTTAIAIELLLLTFVRTAEIRKARWEEFDFEKGEWHIPAGRMKMRVEHFVPLSKQVLALLAELRKITGANEHLFPNLRRPNDYMTPTTINQALKRVGFSGKGTIGFAAHGFRGTAATLLAEQGEYRESVIDRQLAHAERNKVKGAYFHGQYTDERRLMMQSWSDYIDTLRP
jgi:integrase